MKKLLFTHSYYLRFDPKQWATGQPYAPLGTLYAASFMRQHGYEVSFFDSMFARTAAELIPAIAAAAPDVVVIYDDGFNYLTKMCLENMREAAFRMIQYARDRGCMVILSSSDSTDRYDLYLDQGADIILLGEAESTLLAVINNLSAGKADLSAVDGIAFREKGLTVTTKRRPVMHDLDALPFPAWDIIDMAPYRDMWMQHAGYFSMNMGTTRGCPFKCNWCAKPIYGNRFHARSPKNVVAELKLLKQQFGFEHIWFCDDIFGLKPGWIKEFADLLSAEQLSFRFKIQGRADLLLKENDVADLARAGCESIWMGAESGSQKILDAMEKGTTVEQIRQATRLLKKHHIKPCFFIQFGYLSETKEDIKKTIDMITELLPAEIGISVSYPLPGTAFFEKVKADMRIKTNWTDSDELAMMFHTTYPPAFYRRLHRYVHKTYRTHLAFDNLRRLFLHPSGIKATGIKKALSAFYYLPAAIIDKYRLQKLEKPVHHYAS